jgi:DNA-binding NarL/FixJ family response regulator
MIRALIVDDHVFVRAGVRVLLESATDIEVVGEAETGEEAIERAAELAPDIVLMDLSMPRMNGAEATAGILAGHPGAHVLVMTGLEASELVLQAIRAGAAGYIGKTAGGPELLAAVQAVARGIPSLPSEITRELLDLHHEPREPSEPLTSREIEIACLVAHGLSNHEIGDRIHISEGLVGLRKLDAGDQAFTETRGHVESLSCPGIDREPHHGRAGAVDELDAAGCEGLAVEMGQERVGIPLPDHGRAGAAGRLRIASPVGAVFEIGAALRFAGHDHLEAIVVSRQELGRDARARRHRDEIIGRGENPGRHLRPWRLRGKGDRGGGAATAAQHQDSR